MAMRVTVNLVLADIIIFSQLPNNGSASDFMTSCSNTFIQASALILSPTAIALQNIIYNANGLVQFQLFASWSASSNNKAVTAPVVVI